MYDYVPVWFLGRGLVQCCYEGITNMRYVRKPFRNTKGYKQEYCWWDQKSCTAWEVHNPGKNIKTYACQQCAGFLPSTMWTCMCTHRIYLRISMHASVLLTLEKTSTFYRVIRTTHKRTIFKQIQTTSTSLYINVIQCIYMYKQLIHATSGYPSKTKLRIFWRSFSCHLWQCPLESGGKHIKKIHESIRSWPIHRYKCIYIYISISIRNITTLLATNSSHENGWLEDDWFLLGRPILSHVSGGYSLRTCKKKL